MEWIAAGSFVVALLSLCGGLFKVTIINPLNTSIQDLHQLIVETRDYVEKTEEKRQSMATKLASVESSVKSAHHRLDELIHEIH